MAQEIDKLCISERICYRIEESEKTISQQCYSFTQERVGELGFELVYIHNLDLCMRVRHRCRDFASRVIKKVLCDISMYSSSSNSSSYISEIFQKYGGDSLYCI